MSQDRDIEDYIRQTRTTYTREAITNNLLAMGNQEEDIDRIWEIVDNSDSLHKQSSEITPRHKIVSVLLRLASIVGVLLIALVIAVITLVIVISAIAGICIVVGGVHH